MSGACLEMWAVESSILPLTISISVDHISFGVGSHNSSSWRATTKDKSLWRVVSLCRHLHIMRLMDVCILLLSPQSVFKSWILGFWSAQLVPHNYCPKVDLIRYWQIQNLVEECVLNVIKYWYRLVFLYFSFVCLIYFCFVFIKKCFSIYFYNVLVYSYDKSN